MSEVTEIAQPYAKAAFDYARDNQALEQWQQMLDILGMILEQPIVADAVDSLDGEGSEETILDLLLHAGGEWFDEFFQNFLKIMAENRRLKALAEVLAQFRELKAEHEKTMQVTVCVSELLDDEQLAQITNALSAKFGKSITLEQQIDPSLVGGVVIKADQMVFDGSVISNIGRLSTNLHA
ncbi:F0F1 ATP synthase subunit delta [Vibrio porteresiae]|uniref:ATP synthase subunit delta n=1 Tax=Vibrio porteresiae DSM 19223 TaxID=1123496 RepID=A0ABZ0QIV6_9VIBR|nr:F0F1 ATP synthase subunit delta [Vibrio porteresiae]WPC76127.1 F0F1 ATP synthase subunit delta [Vibrio porteresiae DSM 19223]